MNTGKWGEKAKQFTSSIVADRRVKLVFDKEKFDKHGNLSAYVYKGRRFLNIDLIKNGYARVMSIEANTKYKSRFEKGEQKAKLKKIGVWNPQNGLNEFNTMKNVSD
jgi:micrococcal nuclease